MHHQCWQNCQHQEKSDFTLICNHQPDLIFYLLDLVMMALPWLAFNTPTLRKRLGVVGLLGQHRDNSESTERLLYWPTKTQVQSKKGQFLDKLRFFMGHYRDGDKHRHKTCALGTWTHYCAWLHTQRHKIFEIKFRNILCTCHSSNFIHN